MELGDFLTSKEHGKLKNLELTIRLRKDRSCLILIGVDSVEMGNTFEKYLQINIESDTLYIFSPKTNQILYEIHENHENLPLDKFFLIRLDAVESNEKRQPITNDLLFYRDYISKYSLKLIFIFSNDF